MLASSESLHFSPSRCRDNNEFRTSVNTASRSKMMTCTSIQDHMILKVVKNLFSLLYAELCSTFSPTRNSQVCFTMHLNCCSSKADNEALTCYLREAGFIRCAQTVPNTDSIKNNICYSDSCICQVVKDQTPEPVQAYSLACCFPEPSQMSTWCLSEMNHTYKCSVNSLYWQ